MKKKTIAKNTQHKMSHPSLVVLLFLVIIIFILVTSIWFYLRVDDLEITDLFYFKSEFSLSVWIKQFSLREYGQKLFIYYSSRLVHLLFLILIVYASFKKQSYFTLSEFFLILVLKRSFSEYFVAKAFISIIYFAAKHLIHTEETSDMYYSLGYVEDIFHAGLNIGSNFYHYHRVAQRQSNAEPLSPLEPELRQKNHFGMINVYCGKCYNYSLADIALQRSGKCHDYALTTAYQISLTKFATCVFILPFRWTIWLLGIAWFVVWSVTSAQIAAVVFDCFLSLQYLWDTHNRSETILLENRQKKYKSNWNLIIDWVLFIAQCFLLLLIVRLPSSWLIFGCITLFLAISDQIFETRRNNVRFFDRNLFLRWRKRQK